MSHLILFMNAGKEEQAFEEASHSESCQRGRGTGSQVKINLNSKKLKSDQN